MKILLIADIIDGKLNLDQTAKALSAINPLGEATVLCASSDCKHAAEEIGLPGNPKKLLFLLNLANITGFPGLIATLLKSSFILNCLIICGTKSNFPAEIAPDVIINSESELKKFLISFLNLLLSWSFNIFFSLKIIGKEFRKEFI